MARIVCVARDAAPSRAFTRLEPELTKRGHAVQLFVGDGKPITASLDAVRGAASEASIVVLGMSSSKELAEPELVAGRVARDGGIPYGFYGDVRRCFNRARPGAWFEELAEHAAFYFGVNGEDALSAREVFQKAMLEGTGNPLREDMAYPTFSRAEVRQKLGIADDEFMVLCPGGKCATVNIATWVAVQDALAVLDSRKWRMILATHPGDRTPEAVDLKDGKPLKIYDDLVQFAPVKTQFVSKEVLGSSELVPGADLVVEFGSSIGMEAAAQGIPVVTYCTGVAEKRNEKASGTRVTELVELNVSIAAGRLQGLRRLSDVIDGLLIGRADAAHLRSCQLFEFPKAERGAAIRKMADALETIAR